MLDWDGADAYKRADRHVWKVNSADTEVAGFVRQVNDFTQVNNVTIWIAILPIQHIIYAVVRVLHTRMQCTHK